MPAAAAAGILLGFGVYLSWLIRALLAHQGALLDDAYMFARYAIHVNEGLGFSWNAGEGQIYGPTSLAYVLVLAGVMRLVSMEPATLLMALSWALGALALAALLLIGRVVSGDLRSPASGLAALSLLWVVLEPALRQHALSGMDTTLSTLSIALLALCAVLLIQKYSGRRLVVAMLASAGCYLVRPDNLVYAFLVPALALLLFAPDSNRRPVLIFTLFFAALMLADAGLKYAIFGDIFPLSFYVKQNGFNVGYTAAWTCSAPLYLDEFALLALPSILAIALYARRRHLRILAAFLLPMLLTFAYYSSIVQIMGMAARFYFPAVGLLVAPALWILNDADRAEGSLKPGRAALIRGIAVLVVMIIALRLATSTHDACVLPFQRAKIDTGPLARHPIPVLSGGAELIEMGRLSGELPAGTILAASEVGFLGAAVPDLTLIDVTGLNDRRIAHLGFSTEAFLDRRPDLILMPHPDYVPILTGLICSGRFEREYDFHPTAFGYGVALRIDNPHYAEIRTVMAVYWQRLYPGVDMAEATVDPEALRAFCK